MTRGEATELLEVALMPGWPNARWAAATLTTWLDELELLDHDITAQAIVELRRVNMYPPTIAELHAMLAAQRRRRDIEASIESKPEPYDGPTEAGRAAMDEARRNLRGPR